MKNVQNKQFFEMALQKQKIYEIYKINILHPGLNSHGKLTQLTSFHDGLAKLAILLFPHRPTIPSFIFSSIFPDMLAKFRHFYCFQNFGSFHCFIIGPQSPLLNFLVNFQGQACKIVSFYYFCTSLVIFVYLVAEFNTGHISLKLQIVSNTYKRDQ